MVRTELIASYLVMVVALFKEVHSYAQIGSKNSKKPPLVGLKTKSIISFEANYTHSFPSFTAVNQNNQVDSVGRAKLVLYSLLWYAISALYNIYNKKALNAMSLPWTIATIQMGTGIALFLPLWILRFREAPFSSTTELMQMLQILIPVALFTALSHIAGVVALGLGAVSFIQVIKATEPLFTAALSCFVLGQQSTMPKVIAIFGIVAGVAISSVTEITFSWPCLLAGIISNLFAGARSVFSKLQMCGGVACIDQTSPENYYSLITVLSFAMLTPAALLVEGGKLWSLVTIPQSAISSAVFQKAMVHSLASGVLFYLYNELSFKILNQVSPITHAIANTIKRVAIILFSVMVFHNPISNLGLLGSTIALIGAMAYSLIK